MLPPSPQPCQPLPPLSYQSADMVEAVASFALRSRLKDCRSVKCKVSCDTFGLLSGRISSAKVLGEGWRSPLNLTAQVLEVRARREAQASCQARP